MFRESVLLGELVKGERDITDYLTMSHVIGLQSVREGMVDCLYKLVPVLGKFVHENLAGAMAIASHWSFDGRESNSAIVLAPRALIRSRSAFMAR
jgi:hypothetical protein